METQEILMAGPGRTWQDLYETNRRTGAPGMQCIVLRAGRVAGLTGPTQSPAGHPVTVSMTVVPKGSYI